MGAADAASAAVEEVSEDDDGGEVAMARGVFSVRMSYPAWRRWAAKECRRRAGDVLGNTHDLCGLLDGALENRLMQVVAADLAGLAIGVGSGGGEAQALWPSITKHRGVARSCFVTDRARVNSSEAFAVSGRR